MGYNGSVLSVETTAYPALGGGLALFGCFYTFFLTLIAITVGLVVLFKLDHSDPDNHKKLKSYFGDIFYTLKKKKLLCLFSANFLRLLSSTVVI